MTDSDCLEIDKPAESNYNQQKVASQKSMKKDPKVLVVEKAIKTGSRLAKKVDDLELKFFHGQSDGTKLSKIIGKRKKQRAVRQQRKVQEVLHDESGLVPGYQNEDTVLAKKTLRKNKQCDIAKQKEDKVAKDTKKYAKTTKEKKNSEKISKRKGSIVMIEANTSPIRYPQLTIFNFFYSYITYNNDTYSMYFSIGEKNEQSKVHEEA